MVVLVKATRRLSREENVEILAWILPVVVGNGCIAGGFRSRRTLGVEVTVAGAAEIKQLDQGIAPRSNQEPVMAERTHAVYDIVVCGIFVCGFVGSGRSDIVKAGDCVSRVCSSSCELSTYRTVRSPHATRKTSPGEPAKGWLLSGSMALIALQV